ncbi:MAG: DNA-binding protein [Desulfuromonadaceae bacterium]|nr:DNA-binding protein [Desulfuromonadaceae bacterium]MDD5104997.1 DNA-binding protein [Desulfuromonadaceae bacterium]
MSVSNEATGWSCSACGGELEIMKVGFTYMKGNFEVELPACRNCGMVLVSEELATGKMADAERILEDK